MSWKDGDFSNELLNDVKIELAIGKVIECEDGISRMVHEIVPSYKYPWKVVVNEQDPASNAGYFVNLLSLCAQLLGKPIPSKEAQEAFTKVVKVKYKVDDSGNFKEVPLVEWGPYRKWFA